MNASCSTKRHEAHSRCTTVRMSVATPYAAGIIRRDTEVILAGEGMGGGLNHYGDMRRFRLPNSGVEASYSTRYFELWPDTLPSFEMDTLIGLSSEEFFDGQDPVLDSVLQLIQLDVDTN